MQLNAADFGIGEEDLQAYLSDFKEMDKDGDGMLSKEEFAVFCTSDEYNVDNIFAEYDVDGDGNLDLNEYMKYRAFLQHQAQ